MIFNHKAWVDSLNPDNIFYRYAHNYEPFKRDIHVAHDIPDQVFLISDIEILFCIGKCVFDIFCFSFCHTFIYINHGFFQHLRGQLFKKNYCRHPTWLGHILFSSGSIYIR